MFSNLSVKIADYSLPCMYHKFFMTHCAAAPALVIVPLTPQRANVLLSVAPAGRRRGNAPCSGGGKRYPPSAREVVSLIMKKMK